MTAFTGKTILITGAAGGIGREMARHFGGLGVDDDGHHQRQDHRGGKTAV